MSEARVIKRYSNRKLYDLSESRYVTLQEVADFVQAGHEVQILDNKTKEDITSVTMAQILYEQERARRSGLPLGALKNILITSGEMLHRRIATPVIALKGEAEKTVHAFKEEAEKKVSTLKRQAGRHVGRFLANQKEMGEEAKAVVTEVSQATQAALDEFARGLDERIRQVMRFPRTGAAGKTGENAQPDRLDAVLSRLEAIEKRLHALETPTARSRKQERGRGR